MNHKRAGFSPGRSYMAQSISKRTAQQIVETVKDVCNHNINFIDTNGIIFASTDASRVGDFHEIGKQVVTTGRTIEVETDNSFFGTQKGVNIPFVYKGEIMAVIGISGAPDEVRRYAYLAQKITTLILREHEMDARSNSRKAQMNYVVRALTTGEHINHGYFMEFLESYHADFNVDYQTILVQLDSRYNPSNLSLIEKQIYQAFEQTGSPFITFQYPNEYVMFLEAAKLEKWIYIFQNLADNYGGILKIGIGSRCILTRQNQSYQTAKIAVHSLPADRGLALFEDLSLEILLGSVSADAREQFLHKTMERLDEKEKHLLEVYFECDFSLKKTCEKLFIHKNTVQYQLDKIRRMSGYNPRSFRDAVILYLGLRLARSEQ